MEDAKLDKRREKWRHEMDKLRGKIQDARNDTIRSGELHTVNNKEK